MKMNIEGGAALPIVISTNAPIAGPALPVCLYTLATIGSRRVDGGPITYVYVVSDAELASGKFKLEGRAAAIPVIDYSSVDDSIPDAHPIPVYFVTANVDNTNPSPPPDGQFPFFLKLETGDYIKLETGDKLNFE